MCNAYASRAVLLRLSLHVISGSAPIQAARANSYVCETSTNRWSNLLLLLLSLDNFVASCLIELAHSAKRPCIESAEIVIDLYTWIDWVLSTWWSS